MSFKDLADKILNYDNAKDLVDKAKVLSEKVNFDDALQFADKVQRVAKRAVDTQVINRIKILKDAVISPYSNGLIRLFAEHQAVIDNLYKDEFENIRKDLMDDVSKAELSKVEFLIKNLLTTIGQPYVYIDFPLLRESMQAKFPIPVEYYDGYRKRPEFVAIYDKYKDFLPDFNQKNERLMSGYVFLPEAIREAIKSKIIFDFGACDGHGSLLYSEVAKYVYSFEPVTEQYENVKVFLNKAGVSDKVSVVNYGVGDSSSSIEFMHLKGASQVATPELIAQYPNAERSTVNITTIDKFVKDNNVEQIGLMKFDIEGYEYNAIAGAIETIKRDKPVLIISLYHSFKDLFEIKDVINNLGLGYKFMFRHIIADDDVVYAVTELMLNEYVLICYVD